MKTLVQLARDKVAEDLIANHSHTSTLIRLLPVELLVRVDAAFRKKLVEQAIESGEIKKLTRVLGDLIEYVNRLEQKWAQYSRKLQALADDVDKLRQKMKTAKPEEVDLTKDLEAYNQLQDQFRDVTDRRKKMAALILKLRQFIEALEAARSHIIDTKMPHSKQLMDTLTEACARFERLHDRLVDVVSGGLEKADRQMKKIGDELKKKQKGAAPSKKPA